MSKKLKIFALALCAAVTLSIIGLAACNAGADGKDGKSAYDIWLEQGNTGTEQDFLDSLKGDRGETPEIKVGVNGNWYVDGVDTGVKAQGDQGDPGEKGKDGSNWYTGELRPDKDNIAALVTDSKTGDFYLCTEDGTLWRKRGDGLWDKVATLKGPKGDPGESGSDPGFTLNVDVGQTADMPIALPAGVYVVEVALKMPVFVGRLEASVLSSALNYSSVFVFSQDRTDELGDGSKVYYSYVIVKDGDVNITFAPSSDFKLDDGTASQLPKPTAIEGAKVTVKKWEQPTLEADGKPVEVIINSSNVTAEEAFKIPVDESVTDGTYTISVQKIMLGLSDFTSVYNQTDDLSSKGRLTYMSPTKTGTITVTGGALANPWLVFKPFTDGESYRYIVPATVTLTKTA